MFSKCATVVKKYCVFVQELLTFLYIRLKVGTLFRSFHKTFNKPIELDYSKQRLYYLIKDIFKQIWATFETNLRRNSSFSENPSKGAVRKTIGYI